MRRPRSMRSSRPVQVRSDARPHRKTGQGSDSGRWRSSRRPGCTPARFRRRHVLIGLLALLAGITGGALHPFVASGYSGSSISVAGGQYHSVALRSDGSVWAWGLNGNGQLGNGSTTASSTPVQVTGLPTTVTAIAAGGYFSLALLSNGTVWAWGSNNSGQLGNGTTTDSSIPVQVSGLTGVTSITGGVYHALAVRSDGTLWAWGYNVDGQLGNGTTTNSTTPVQVGLGGVVAIAAAGFHSVATRSDGTVWAWGLNGNGELGNGTTTNSTTPVQVSGLSRVTALAAGGYHSLALRSDGTVWVWGYNGYGQLGNGTVSDSSTPVQVPGLGGVVALTAGFLHSVAARSDGTVWAWGLNGNGQLGNGTTTNATTPVQVSIGGVTAIGVGGYHSLLARNDGTLWACGLNGNGQLGNGTTTNATTPVQVQLSGSVQQPPPPTQQPLASGSVTQTETYGTNCACANPGLGQSFAGHPINTAFGNFTETLTDISIAGRGIPLQLSRTYNSLAAAAGSSGPLGNGWASGIFMSLSQPGGSGPVTITEEGGAQEVFNPSGSGYTPAVPS